MQTKQVVILFGNVSTSATSRSSKNGRKYTAFEVATISDRSSHRNLRATGPYDRSCALREGK